MENTHKKLSDTLITIVCGISLFTRGTKKKQLGCEVCDNNNTKKKQPQNPAGITENFQGHLERTA